MKDLFDTPQRPEWILLLVGNDHAMRQEQKRALAPYVQELESHGIAVVNITPTETNVLHGDYCCNTSADDLADLYQLSLENFSATLIGRDDCVKWAAPIPMSFRDIVAVVENMPLREAENATRGPASSM